MPKADTLSIRQFTVTDIVDFFQYKLLQETVFAPLKEKLAFVYLALTNAAYITTVLAFNAGRLYVPKDKQDGEFLTMLYIK